MPKKKKEEDPLEAEDAVTPTYTGQTWSNDHPHANDKQWVERSYSGRSVLWGWAKCLRCCKRTAIASGYAGQAICDACFDAPAIREDAVVSPDSGDEEGSKGR